MKIFQVTLLAWWSLQVVRVVTEQMPDLVCCTSNTTDMSCRYLKQNVNQHEFIINGYKVIVYYKQHNSYFKMNCKGQTALDDPALPYFTKEYKALTISLEDCLLPRHGGSIQRALAALNVTLQCDTDDECEIQLRLPGALPMIASHFVGLETMKVLRVKGITGAADFLTTLPMLRRFEVSDVTMDIDAVLSSSLFNLTVWDWTPQITPSPLSRCKSLRSLVVYMSKVTSLPPRWLAACPHLQLLQLFGRIKQLPRELLFNTTELITLQVKYGKFEELPYDIFYHSPKLHTIRFSENALKILPSKLFVNSVALRVLYLLNNKLQPSALEAFTTPSLKDLLELRLDSNPTLKDFCTTSQEYSKLTALNKLEELSLVFTNVTNICRDWRTKMQLKILDLQYTQISQLQLKDLEFEHPGNVSVLLTGAPVSSVQFDEDSYSVKPTSATSGNVFVLLSSDMQCDCSMYGTWRALRDGRWPKNLHFENPITCDTTKGFRDLRDLVEEDLICAANSSVCGLLSSKCTCAVRPLKGGTQHLRVSCERTALTAIPTELRSIPYSVDLLLAHNNISYLHLDELPPKLKKLDISNNTIQALDIKTVTSLVGEGRTLNISSNPLTCSCEHKDVLEMLLKHIDTAVYTGVTCAGGEVLALVILECSPSVSLGLILGTSLVAFLAVTFAVVACLVRRNTRLYAAVLLDRLGLLRWRNDADDGLLYDVFVSFSHGDEEFLLDIVKWLEDRSPPYRLCLHYRDWVPGRSISEQISESVMSSRRTLALVSTNFLNSNWARAEFREAHAYALRDVTRRLVVVLLQDKDSLELDAELRRYLAVNTYLQWGDTWFWDKLKLALPRPCPRSPQSSPSLSRAVPLPLLSIDAVPFNDRE